MARRKKKSAGRGFFLGAALGAVVGGVVGILTAPKSGKQTRKDIKRGGKKVARKAKTGGRKLRRQTERVYRKATGGRNPQKKSTKSRK